MYDWCYTIILYPMNLSLHGIKDSDADANLMGFKSYWQNICHQCQNCDDPAYVLALVSVSGETDREQERWKLWAFSSTGMGVMLPFLVPSKYWMVVGVIVDPFPYSGTGAYKGTTPYTGQGRNALLPWSGCWWTDIAYSLGYWILLSRSHQSCDWGLGNVFLGSQCCACIFYCGSANLSGICDAKRLLTACSWLLSWNL